MTQVEQIKAEIERRMKNNQQDTTESGEGAFFEDKELLSFINSLPAEQPSEDLDDEIYNYWRNELTTEDIVTISKDDFIFHATHFANWQKEQMMKDAVNGIMDCDDDNEWIEITDKLIVTPSRAGKKVKIIIIMEDEK